MCMNELDWRCWVCDPGHIKHGHKRAKRKFRFVKLYAELSNPSLPGLNLDLRLEKSEQPNACSVETSSIHHIFFIV
jgi:hypothetical protein